MVEIPCIHIFADWCIGWTDYWNRNCGFVVRVWIFVLSNKSTMWIWIIPESKNYFSNLYFATYLDCPGCFNYLGIRNNSNSDYYDSLLHWAACIRVYVYVYVVL